jgi:GMP synthase (glutamine-hydrolysing)
VKIGILECDHVDTELKIKHGDHSSFFINLFKKYAPEVSLDIFDIPKGEYPDWKNNYDGFIGTGSRFSVYDNMPWIERFKDFIKELYENNVKFIGICFGHQMIAEALGGKCSESKKGWGLGVKTAFIHQKQPWMKPPLDSYRLIFTHKDQIETLPPESKVLGGNDHCEYSVITLGSHFLGIQGHPEFTAPFVKELLQSRLELIGHEAVEEAEKTLVQQTDEAVVTQWMVKFFDTSF